MVVEEREAAEVVVVDKEEAIAMVEGMMIGMLLALMGEQFMFILPISLKMINGLTYQRRCVSNLYSCAANIETGKDQEIEIIMIKVTGQG